MIESTLITSSTGELVCSFLLFPFISFTEPYIAKQIIATIKQLPKIYNPKKHDMILTYYYNGKCWCYGFYTDSKNHPEIDCSQIAIKYGGGGHKGAAGATLNYLLEELI
jgi:hypothetical protein